MKRVLGFDLGTKCGWAFGAVAEGLAACGLLRTQPTRFESQGMRYIKFEKGVRALLETYKPDLVVFERVHAHTGTYAAQVYGAYSAILMKLCDEHDIPYTGYTVQEIKKHAGKSNASKALMLGLAKYKFRHLDFETNDVADAAHLTDLAISKL